MPRYIALTVASAEPAGPGIVQLTLRDPDGYALPRIKPGAHLDFIVPDVGPRAYSLCGDPAVADAWTIAVKLVSASRGGSAWLHGLRQGDAVEATMPRCTFPLEPNATSHVMVAGGIGVTPFLAMAPVLQRQGADWMLHVLARHEPPCAAALAPWMAAGRARFYDTARAPRPGWDTLLGAPAPFRQAYCCGPEAMLAGFQAATATWPEGSTRVEHFVPPPLPAAPDARPFTLRRAATGAQTEVAAGASLLAALRGLGAAVESSCEGGICGACEIRWLEGRPIHRDRILSPTRQRTHLMACVAQCASDLLVVDA